MRLVSADEMRAIERIAIEEMGIPAATLMERAGRAVADAAAGLAGPAGRVVVVCGAGNNGGDGFVAARLLHAAGRGVLAVALGAPGKGSPESLATWKAAEEAGVPVAGLQALLDFPVRAGDLVVDALLGTGLERGAEGPFAAAIDAIANLRAQGARVLSVDLPSGLATDTGRAIGPVVRADATVDLRLLEDRPRAPAGADLAGEVTVVDIGIPPGAADRIPSTAELLDEAAARALVPRRRPRGAQGRFRATAGGGRLSRKVRGGQPGAHRGPAGRGGTRHPGGPHGGARPRPGRAPGSDEHPAPGCRKPGRGATSRRCRAPPRAPTRSSSGPASPGARRRLRPSAGSSIATRSRRSSTPTPSTPSPTHPGLVAVIGHAAPIVLTPHRGRWPGSSAGRSRTCRPTGSGSPAARRRSGARWWS